MSDGSDEAVGCLFGAFAFLIGGGTFLACWGYAIAAYGWFLGLAFGWVPSAIIAVITVVLSPLIILGAIVVGFIYLANN
jgi:hypothetical protein